MADPLKKAIFQDVTKARKWLEALLWADGRVCGYCGVVDESTPIRGRDGYYQCNACRKQFTVTVGTVFERSHIPLNKWLLAAFLLCASKKGMSAHQMHRMLGITYKSAWFMMMRLREAMALLASTFRALGGEGKTVEIDETFIGGLEKNKHPSKRKHVGTGGAGKQAVFALVERRGHVRSHHVARVNAKTLRPILMTQVHRASSLIGTDIDSEMAQAILSKRREKGEGKRLEGRFEFLWIGNEHEGGYLGRVRSSPTISNSRLR
jgi:transposase-like protein